MRKIEMKIGGNYNYRDEKSDVKFFNYNDLYVKQEIVENLYNSYDIEVEVEDIKEVIYKKHYEDISNVEDNFLVVEVELVIELKFEKLSMKQLVLLEYWMREYGGEIDITGVCFEVNSNFDFLNNVDHGISYVVYDKNAGLNWKGERNCERHFDELDQKLLRFLNKLILFRLKELDERIEREQREELKNLARFEIEGVYFEKEDYYFDFRDCGVYKTKEEILEMNDSFDYIKDILNEVLHECDLVFEEVVEVKWIINNVIKGEGDYDVNYKVKLRIKEEN